MSFEQNLETSSIRSHFVQHHSFGESTEVEISEGQGNLSSADVGVVSVQLGITLLNHADPDFIAVRTSLGVERSVVVGDRKVVIDNDFFNLAVLSEFEKESSRSLPVVSVE